MEQTSGLQNDVIRGLNSDMLLRNDKRQRAFISQLEMQLYSGFNKTLTATPRLWNLVTEELLF